MVEITPQMLEIGVFFKRLNNEDRIETTKNNVIYKHCQTVGSFWF